MTTIHPLRFGLETLTEGAPWDELLRVWRFADDLGFDSLWTSDHVTPSILPGPDLPVFEGWTALAALAASTRSARCGVMITGNGYRNPALLAKMAVTIDHISGGRLNMGIGSGWHQPEHAMYGFDFPEPAERVHRMGEAVQIMRALWTEERPSFKGRYYQIDDAICEPKPVNGDIPIWIGGGGEQLTARYVARYADAWNFIAAPEDAARKLAALRRHCQIEGRDYDSIEKTLMLLNIHMTDDPADVTRFLEHRREERSRSTIGDRPLEDLRRTHMVGTPDDMSALIREHIANGFTHFAVQALHPYDYTALERFYNEVALPLKREHPLS